MATGNTPFDVILSDIARGNDSTAGLTMLPELRKKNRHIPVIFYIGEIDTSKGVPGSAFGITNQPNELLHLALDALERTKYGN